ncbi:MAG: hypothetical protein ACR2P6_02365, partial [Gammaproteobacteria bacterium]
MNPDVRAAIERGATVVTPGKRAARELSLEFGRLQLTKGQSAWRSPNVLPWRGWLNNCWQQSLLAGGTAIDYRLISDQQSRLVWEDVVRSSDVDVSLNSVESLARMAMRTWQLQQDWCCSSKQLDGFASAPDHMAYRNWAQAYEAACQQNDWVDQAKLPELLLAEPRHWANQADIVFFAFTRWSPRAEQILSAIQTAESPASTVSPGIKDAQAHRIDCADADAELETAARWARSRFERKAEERIAVVVPDLATRNEKARRVFQDVFSPHWRLDHESGAYAPVNFSYGRPLSDCGLVRTAMEVLK